MLTFHHHVAVTFLLTAGTFRMSCHATFKEPEKEAPEMCAVGVARQRRRTRRRGRRAGIAPLPHIRRACLSPAGARRGITGSGRRPRNAQGGRQSILPAMSTVAATNAAAPPAWKLWTGRVLSGLPALGMLFSGAMKLSHSPMFIEKWVGTFGYPESAATAIGIIEILCVVVYLVPKTKVLGAILMTGYLGGAVATHVRVSDPGFVTPILLGIFVWGGLFLRDERIANVIPVSKT